MTYLSKSIFDAIYKELFQLYQYYLCRSSTFSSLAIHNVPLSVECLPLTMLFNGPYPELTFFFPLISMHLPWAASTGLFLRFYILEPCGSTVDPHSIPTWSKHYTSAVFFSSTSTSRDPRLQGVLMCCN